VRAARASGACPPCLPRMRLPTCRVLDDTAEAPPAAAGAAPKRLTGTGGPVRSRPTGGAADSPVQVLGRLGPGVGAVPGLGGSASMLAELAAPGPDSDSAAAAVESGMDDADAWQLVSARGADSDAAGTSIEAAAGMPSHFADALAVPPDGAAPHWAGVHAALEAAHAASPEPGPDDEHHDAPAEAAEEAAGAHVGPSASTAVPGLPPARQSRAGNGETSEERACSEHTEAAGYVGSLEHEETSGVISLLLEPAPATAAAGGLDEAGAAACTTEAHAEMAPGELSVHLEPPEEETSFSVIVREDATDGADLWSMRDEGGEVTEGAVTLHASASLPVGDQDDRAACTWQQGGRSSGRCHAQDEHGQPVPHTRMLERAYRRFNQARYPVSLLGVPVCRVSPFKRWGPFTRQGQCLVLGTCLRSSAIVGFKLASQPPAGDVCGTTPAPSDIEWQEAS